jgi:hypothetical protein
MTIGQPLGLIMQQGRPVFTQDGIVSFFKNPVANKIRDELSLTPESGSGGHAQPQTKAAEEHH